MASEILQVILADGVETEGAVTEATLLQTQLVSIPFTAAAYDLDVAAAYGWDARKCAVLAMYQETGDYEDEGFSYSRPAGSSTTLRISKADSSTVTYKAVIAGSP